MKKLFKILALFGLMGIPLAFADFPSTTKQFVEKDAGINILDNPGFEFGAHNWNLAGIASTFSITSNASTVGVGGQSGVFPTLEAPPADPPAPPIALLVLP